MADSSQNILLYRVLYFMILIYYINPFKLYLGVLVLFYILNTLYMLWMVWDIISYLSKTKFQYNIFKVFVGYENVSPHFEKRVKGTNFMFLIITHILLPIIGPIVLPIVTKEYKRLEKVSTISLNKMVACQRSKFV